MKKIVIMAIIATMVLSVSVLGQPNLIVNGDFETPVVGITVGHRGHPTVTTHSDWDAFIPDQVPGWTVQISGNDGGPPGPDLEFWNTLMPGMPYSGEQYVELDGWDPTKISQVVSTIPGAPYELSYAWRPRSGVNCQMKVWVDGVEVGNHSGTSGGWTHVTYPFTATSSSTTIAFAEVGPDDQLGMLLDAVNLVLVPIVVDIDIKPGSWPNAINLGSKGVIPVAVLSSEDFDATTVDPSTVLLGGVDVAVRGKGSKLMAHIEDVDGDGLIDLVVQVDTEAAGLWTSGTVILTATTYDGQDIIGSDEVVIVPPE